MRPLRTHFLLDERLVCPCSIPIMTFFARVLLRHHRLLLLLPPPPSLSLSLSLFFLLLFHIT